MKIGIVGDGYQMITLFKFLNKYENEYFFWYDSKFWPWGDKSFELGLDRVLEGIHFLKQKGVEKIIVPPIYELAVVDDSVIPLFKSYLLNYVFKKSLVGKVGILGDFSDLIVGQKLLFEILSSYVMTESQSNTKNFKFSFWAKNVKMWKYFLIIFAYSNFMVNKTIKFDLRYFKDANVDTILPCNYGYFNYQKTISKYFNNKKTRFHKMDVLEKIYVDFVEKFASGKYLVNFFATDSIDCLLKDKRAMRLMNRGNPDCVNFQLL